MRRTAPGLPVRRQGQQVLTRAAEGRYRLGRNESLPPWADSMKETFRAELGQDVVGARATDLCMASLAPTSVATYASTFKKFLKFCSEEHLVPIQVKQRDIVRYIAWLAQEGRIGADNLQPYLSSINRFLRDHLLDPVASGALVVAARRGFKRLQEDLAPAPVRVALPATMAQACLVQAERLKNATSRERLLFLRNFTAIATNFLFPIRGSSMVGLLREDFVINKDSFQLFCRQCKGFGAEKLENHPLLQIPIEANQRLATILQAWQTSRDRAFEERSPSHYWQLPGEDPTLWTADTVTSWLQQAAAWLGEAPEEGQKWTSHSLRKGGASAANAAGVSITLIRYLGGWSKTSHVVLDYIDPLILPSAEGSLFFGWLSSSRFQPV